MRATKYCEASAERDRVGFPIESKRKETTPAASVFGRYAKFLDRRRHPPCGDARGLFAARLIVDVISSTPVAGFPLCKAAAEE